MVNLLGDQCQVHLPASDGKSAFIGGMKQAVERKQKVESTLADRLSAAIAGRMTRAALAKRVGVERQTVYYWFNGKTKSIDSEALLRVANVLGLRLEWLQTGAGAMYRSPDLSEDEHQLVAFFRRMEATDQGVLMKMARNLAKDSAKPASEGDPFPAQVAGR